MKVKCPCGHFFQINLDFREHYRKKALLEGTYSAINVNLDSFYEKVPGETATPPQNKRDASNNCTVKDLSVGGVGLDIWGPHELEKDDELFLEFKLDNSKRTAVRCIVIVKTVRNNLIGAEFKNKNDVLPSLGFYFM